jgi:hypothetical protein
MGAAGSQPSLYEEELQNGRYDAEMPDSRPQKYDGIRSFVEGELRNAANMLDRALHDLTRGDTLQAGENLMKAKSSYLVASQRMRDIPFGEEMLGELRMNCDIVENAIRTLERIAENHTNGSHTSGGSPVDLASDQLP